MRRRKTSLSENKILFHLEWSLNIHMCGFLGKVNPESTSDSIVRLLWWQVLKIGFINFLGLHRKWVVLVRFCPVRTRTLSVTQKLRRLIAFTVWLPGQRWWDVGPVAALPHTLREGWGPDPPPPRWIRVTSETTTEMRKLHHKERFLSLFLLRNSSFIHLTNTPWWLNCAKHCHSL